MKKLLPFLFMVFVFSCNSTEEQTKLPEYDIIKNYHDYLADYEAYEVDLPQQYSGNQIKAISDHIKAECKCGNLVILYSVKGSEYSVVSYMPKYKYEPKVQLKSEVDTTHS